MPFGTRIYYKMPIVQQPLTIDKKKKMIDFMAKKQVDSKFTHLKKSNEDLEMARPIKMRKKEVTISDIQEETIFSDSDTS